MIYAYSIPILPKSLNRYMGRENSREYRAEKKTWAQIVDVYCRPKPPRPLEKARVTLTFRFPDSRRRDPDNYIGGSKPLMDGLVRAGIIKDDSFDCIELAAKLGEIKATGSVEVEVEECAY